MIFKSINKITNNQLELLVYKDINREYRDNLAISFKTNMIQDIEDDFQDLS